MIPLQAVHFKLIRTVQIILIYPVHLKVIWAVHLNRCNQTALEAEINALYPIPKRIKKVSKE